MPLEKYGALLIDQTLLKISLVRQGHRADYYRWVSYLFMALSLALSIILLMEA